MNAGHLNNFRALSPSSSISSRSNLSHWSSMPPHSPVVAYSPALYLSFSATEIALGCVTSLSNNNYAYNRFINRNAQLACSRTDFRCSRQFGHYSTITTTTYELQDHHHQLTGSMPVSYGPSPLAFTSTVKDIRKCRNTDV
uniref:Uncharacterized protein n=1 Tax=Mesocestoides corti TaxID=53468 RepID=A0A5K3G2R5_MESCO